MNSILILHLIVTALLAGLIWFVQIVHYPLFREVGQERWQAYHRAHVKRTTWVAAPLMICEGILTTILTIDPTIHIVARTLLVISLIGVWLSTFLVQVPLHNRLAVHHESRGMSRLVWTNWPRTLLWTLRVALLAWLAVH